MQAAVPGCFVKRWWGRGSQKSPPETFVRGLAVPPCSTPVTMPKKDPKKLCAFWGLISVPVVGVEPTRCHHQRILSPSRLPIPTHRLICCLYSILQACQKIKIYFALIFTAIPHDSKCRYGERGAADAKPKAQIILDAAKVSAASGGNSEQKQGQRSQSARGFCPRSTMRVPQPDIIEHFGNADAVPQPPKRCLSRKAGIVRCCPKVLQYPSERKGGA